MRLALFAALVLALILVPFFFWEEDILRLGRRMLDESRGAWWLAPAIAALLAADVFLPVPSSLLSGAAGVLLGGPEAFLTILAGMTAGSLLGFAAGGPAGARMLDAAARRRLERLWARWGPWTLVLTRPVPVLAEAAAVFAGASRMPRRAYLLYSTLGNAAVALFYAGAGAFASRWVS